MGEKNQITKRSWKNGKWRDGTAKIQTFTIRFDGTIWALELSDGNGYNEVKISDAMINFMDEAQFKQVMEEKTFFKDKGYRGSIDKLMHKILVFMKKNKQFRSEDDMDHSNRDSSR